MDVTPERFAFRYFLRTGRRMRTRDTEFCNGEDVSLKFNPYHDPHDGRFTFASGGSGRSGVTSRVRGRQPAPSANAKGPLKTYADRSDLHEEAARTINRIATTAHSTGEIKIGGVTYSIRRTADRKLELTARDGKIVGELQPASNRAEVVISNINVSAPLKVASQPTQIRFFRAKDGRTFYRFDKDLIIGPTIFGPLVRIAAGNHPIDQ